MIVLIRKRNLAIAAIVFLLALILYSFNAIAGEPTTAVNTPNVQKTVIIDPGHGGEDPGAVSDYTGLREKEVNLSIGLAVRGMLEKDGYKVLMTREEDILEYTTDSNSVTRKRFEDLTRRKKMMDEAGADIVVSIHLNKFPQTNQFGAQVFYPPNSRESQKLAEGLQKAIKEVADPENKRVAMLKKEPIIILKNFKTTTAIVECGFLSNQEEERKLADKAYQEKLAVAVYEGIKKYFQ